MTPNIKRHIFDIERLDLVCEMLGQKVVAKRTVIYVSGRKIVLDDGSHWLVSTGKPFAEPNSPRWIQPYDEALHGVDADTEGLVERLLAFYGTDNVHDLVAQQARQIERLQAQLKPTPDTQGSRVRFA